MSAQPDRMQHRPPNPVRTASKTLRAIFEIIDRGVITQKSVARSIGRTPSVMSLYRAGRALPDIMAAEAIAEVLGYRIELVPIERGEGET